MLKGSKCIACKFMKNNDSIFNQTKNLDQVNENTQTLVSVQLCQIKITL